MVDKALNGLREGNRESQINDLAAGLCARDRDELRALVK